MRFFINRAKRLVRTLHPGDERKFVITNEGEPEADWTEVTEGEYDHFILQSERLFSSKELRDIRSGARKYLELLQDEYEGKPCLLTGAANGIGYVGTIHFSVTAAKKWAKAHNYILI